jgi:hypothetical protein
MDDESLSGPTDTAAPWTIKSVPTKTRELVTVAARKEGLTVGQWLERRVNEWVADGEPALVRPDQPGSALVSVPVSPAGGGVYAGTEMMVRLALELAAAPPELAKDPLVTVARRTVRAQLARLRPAD